MDKPDVVTPHGTGKFWGLEQGKVVVEMDFSYLVHYDPEDVEFQGGMSA